jgi:type II secretory pathway pseudopilin PulG
MKFNFHKNKIAQVWVETVLYTMIAFTIIGFVLAYAQPEIEKFQDKSAIKQSIDLMADLDSKILEVVRNGEGNKRVLELSIKKGSLNINGTSDCLTFEIESSYPYTEVGESYSEKGISITTSQIGGKNKITLLKNYSETLNITYFGKEETKIISKSSTFYSAYVENKGGTSPSKTVVEMGLM